MLDTLFGSGRPFGILDTTENPCCCKLLADLEFMGQQLGISFGPHTFLNGKPVSFARTAAAVGLSFSRTGRVTPIPPLHRPCV